MAYPEPLYLSSSSFVHFLVNKVQPEKRSLIRAFFCSLAQRFGYE